MSIREIQDARRTPETCRKVNASTFPQLSLFYFWNTLDPIYTTEAESILFFFNQSQQHQTMKLDSSGPFCLLFSNISFWLSVWAMLTLALKNIDSLEEQLRLTREQLESLNSIELFEKISKATSTQYCKQTLHHIMQSNEQTKWIQYESRKRIE